jgi:hypothetical protein
VALDPVAGRHGLARFDVATAADFPAGGAHLGTSGQRERAGPAHLTVVTWEEDGCIGGGAEGRSRVRVGLLLWC